MTPARVRLRHLKLFSKIPDSDFTGNYYYDRINSDKLAPPGTDHGQTINAQWPMGKFASFMGNRQS